jgi:hypothetical protein
MKQLLLTFTLILSVASPVLAQTHPRPPGIQQAEAADQQAQKDIPPPAKPVARIDTERLAKEADELAAIAKTIPTDVDNIQKGLIDKNTVEKLRRIEKLAKQLRNEVGR